MNTNEINIDVTREIDDDCYVYTAQASKLGKSAFDTGYTRETAIKRAIEKLNRIFGLNPMHQNLENLIENKLAELSQAEKDYQNYLNMFQIAPDVMLAQ